METKKMYEQPKFEEVKLRMQGHLLAQSDEDLAPAMHEINDDF